MRPIINYKGKFIEGFFNNEADDYPQYPMPLSGLRKERETWVRKFYSLQEKASKVGQKGSAKCRICGKRIGSITYFLGEWCWPEGLLHYIVKHNYEPSKHFKRFVKLKGKYLPNVRWGFTGAQAGTRPKVIYRVLKSKLKLKSGDQVVTGACIGVDAQVAMIVKKYFPDVYQVVVVPANRSKVDKRVYDCANEVYEMPEDTSYRARNEALVKLSHYMVAFWSGRSRGGTFMTMNIAKKQNKLYHIEHSYKRR